MADFPLSENDVVRMAIEAGFDDGARQVHLSGESPLDERVCCAEYPVGEDVMRFARLLWQACGKA